MGPTGSVRRRRGLYSFVNSCVHIYACLMFVWTEGCLHVCMRVFMHYVCIYLLSSPPNHEVKGVRYSTKKCFAKALELEDNNPRVWFSLGMQG